MPNHAARLPSRAGILKSQCPTSGLPFVWAKAGTRSAATRIKPVAIFCMLAVYYTLEARGCASRKRHGMYEMRKPTPTPPHDIQRDLYVQTRIISGALADFLAASLASRARTAKYLTITWSEFPNRKSSIRVDRHEHTFIQRN